MLQYHQLLEKSGVISMSLISTVFFIPDIKVRKHIVLPEIILH